MLDEPINDPGETARDELTAATSMKGKTVLITGGTSGIGRAAAVELASMGARVGITGRDRGRAEHAASAITDESGNPAVDHYLSAPAFRHEGHSDATLPTPTQ